jgi:hypothetical protein
MKCKNCDNETKFVSKTKGYRTFCSVKCSNTYKSKQPDFIQKLKDNNSHYWKGKSLKHEGQFQKGHVPYNLNLILSEETKEKISKSHINLKHSDETKEKIKTNNGKYWKNKNRSDETKEKIKSTLQGNIPWNINLKGVVKDSDETRLKKRLMRIKQIEFQKGKISPNYNKKACEYFDNLMIEENIKIQHALNDGEFYIKELGYWVDGYDKESNTVYEYDEKRHFDKNGTLKERDIKRQIEIENFLNCKFIRIKE